MKVFISWSGERSRAVAEALRDWLPQVIQTVDPWVSVADIEKGSRWASDIASQLEECRVGLICLTPENLSAPWLLFEAGALAKTLDKTFVCPYLLDLQFSDIRDPLAQFQLTRADEEDTRKLLHTINKAVTLVANEHTLPETRLNAQFEKWWPDLKSTLQHIPTPSGPMLQQRSEQDLLEEILAGVRGLARSFSSALQQLRTLYPWLTDEEVHRFVSPATVNDFVKALHETRWASTPEALKLLFEARKAAESEERKGVEGKDADS